MFSPKHYHDRAEEARVVRDYMTNVDMKASMEAIAVSYDKLEQIAREFALYTSEIAVTKISIPFPGNRKP